MNRQAFFYSFFFCLILLASNVHAQMILLRDVGGTPWKTNSYIDVEGSPYLAPDWVDGYIKLIGSSTAIKDVKLKFDTYSNELIVLKDKTPIVVANLAEFGWKDQSNDSVKFKLYEIKGFKKGYFFQALFIGENILLKNISTTISTASAGYSDARKTKKFETTERLILKNASGVFDLKNKKDIKQALSGYGDELEKAISKNNVSVRDEKSLIALLQELEK